MWKLAGLLLIAQVPDVPTAAQAMRDAHADLARLPAYQRPNVRYLYRGGNTSAEKWTYFRPVYNGHANQLSRFSILKRLTPVGQNLLRVYLKDYRWTPETWELLVDPYSSEAVVIDKVFTWQGGTWPKDGKWYAAGSFQYTQAVKQVNAVAPWFIEEKTDEQKVKELIEWTGSTAPLVNAEWWFNQTAAQQGRQAGYNAWLGIKTVKDFEALIGFNEAASKSFRFELRAAVAISGVTHHPRAFERWDSAGGAYWKSLEFKAALKDANPLNVLGRDIASKSDGSEGYGVMANGLWATYAADAKGNLVDVVPGDIASNHASPSNDRQVHANVSCIECHGPQPGQLQPIDDWARSLLNPPLELKVRGKEYEGIEALEDRRIELAEQYLRDFRNYLAKDQNGFELAIKEATGLTGKEYAARYLELFRSIEDRKVTTEYAARDLGIEAPELRRKMLTWIKAGYELSPTASALIHEGKAARVIPQRQFEETLPELHRVVRGVK